MSKNTGNTPKTTRVVVTPGTDPALTQNGAGEDQGGSGDGSEGTSADAFTALGSVAGGEDAGTGAQDAGQAEPSSETTALQKQVAELAAMVKALSAQRPQSSMPPAVKLPAMAEVRKDSPTVPVLTDEGWYVPEKTLATRA